MHKPNVSKALADAIWNVVQQVQCNKSPQHLEVNSRILASTLVNALNNHSLIDISSWIKWRMDTSIKPDHRAVNKLSPNNLNAQMNDVKNVREISKKTKRQKSKLEPYRAEIIFYKEAGFSLSEIRDWLRRYQRTQVNRTTILRKLEEWNKHGKT